LYRDKACATTVIIDSPNLIVEGGGLYLIKGSYYSNLLKQGVPGGLSSKRAQHVSAFILLG